MSSFAHLARSQANGGSQTNSDPAGGLKNHMPRPPWAPVQRLERPRSGLPETAPNAPRPNRSGLPEALKAGVEALSGLSMDDVRVHRNSSEPEKLGALAYAQGTDIHLGPAQDHHLPHEAWHIVQQKQGWVQASPQRSSRAIHDAAELEREADVMGAAAAGLGDRLPTRPPSHPPEPILRTPPRRASGAPPIQRKVVVGSKEYALDAAKEMITRLAENSGITADTIETAAVLWDAQDFRFHGEFDVLAALQNWTFGSRPLGRNGQGGRQYGRSSAFTDLDQAKTLVTFGTKIDAEAEREKLGFLYRAMSTDEFNEFKKEKKLIPVDDNAYLGLSANPHYSAGAMTKDRLSHLVEFQFTSQTVHAALIAGFEGGKIEGTASNQGFDVPKDMSTRSIGMGPQGNASEELKEKFNAWLGDGTIQWRLLRLIK